jgi:phage repressor protein C with HTH and peptisase S24 domain
MGQRPDFQAIVRARLAELDLKAYAVEQTSPLKEGSVRNVLRGRVPGLGTAFDICEALGLELYIGPPRQDPDEPLVDRDDEDLEMIRRFDVAVGAGHGAPVLDEIEREPLAFRRDWLLRQGIKPARAALLKARGPSMEPLIWDGDLVMIDRDRVRIPVARPGRDNAHDFWVVRRDGELLVKDVERPDEQTVILSSMNPRYRPTTVRLDAGTDFEVIGRVAWWGHTVPL